MTIRILPPHLVNQIAAGEVVERPASAVKELVENSIDAGATDIHVFISNGGLSKITVRDNGKGMSKDELPVAVERHATSKLHDDNLDRIESLGFRGEALPSIGSIAHLTIKSRTHNSDSGWQIVVDSGQKSAPSPAAMNQGTSIDIENIFNATPARLKFMKSPATESAQVADILRRLALACPSVGFSLSTEKGNILSLPASLGDFFSKIRRRAIDILGDEFARNHILVDNTRDDYRVYGMCSTPGYSRGNAQMQFFVVNGRPVKDRQLLSALRAAYQDVLASDRYPYAALYINIPPQDLDVNVHPAKTEVRFKDAAKVRTLLIASIRSELAKQTQSLSGANNNHALAAAFQSGQSGGFAQPAQLTAHTAHTVWQRQNTQTDFGRNFPPAARTQIASSTFAPDSAAETNDNAKNFPLGAAVAQIHENYILAQNARGMVVVDQHAAHERIVYEKIKSQLGKSPVARQILLIPEIVRLPAGQSGVVAERAQDLEKLGIAVEEFGADTIMVREIPAMMGGAAVGDMIKQIAADLTDMDGSIEIEKNLWKICSSMACYGSVRSGRILNHAEMNALLRQMEQTPNSGQCNHGRPTFIELGLNDIEKLFGRR